jgi:hypothetical protein
VLTRLRTSPAFRTQTTTASTSRVAAVAASLAPFAIAFAVYSAALFVMDPEAIGDEPHYFLFAQSLVLDGDLDLANDYASRERTLAACECFPLKPQAYRYTGADALVPYHGAGVALLLAPAVALGGLGLVRLSMVLVAALLAHQLFGLLAQLGVARPIWRWSAWVAVAFCLPLLAFSSQIYPEVAGALLTVIALRVLVTPSPSRRAYLVGAIAGAALPWLHARFWPISVLVFAGLVYRAFRGISLRTVLPRVAVPYAVSAGALAGLLVALYGGPLPNVAYEPESSLTIGSGGWTFWHRYLLADFLNPGVGWLPYAPVHWLGLAGIGCAIWLFRGAAVAVLAAVLGYAVFIESIGHPVGFEFPARFMIVVIPLVAIPLAIALETVRAARLVFVPLLAVSLVFAAAALRDHESLYPFLGERYTARLFGVRSIQTAFPDTSGDKAPTSFVTRPGIVPPQVGRIEGGRVIASRSRGDQAGFVLDGPYIVLRGGRYRARFSLSAGGAQDDAVARVDVSSGGPILAQRSITPTRAAAGPSLGEVTLVFSTPGNQRIQTRVYYEGVGELAAGRVRVSPVGNPAAANETLPDWPLAFLWVAGTALVGVLFVQVRERHHPDDLS